MKDLTLGEYFHGESFLHRLDPRTKLIGLFVIAGISLSVQNWMSAGILLVLIAGSILISRLPAGVFLANVRSLRYLIIFTVLIHFFFGDGRIVFTLPILEWNLTTGGIDSGLFFGTRIVLIILAAGLFTATTQPIDLAGGIEKLIGKRKIFGFTSREILMIIVLSLRFVPVFIGEARRLKKCQLARGLSFRGSLKKKLNAFVPLLVPIFISSLRRADKVARAMESRGWHGGEGRTRFHEPEFSACDTAVGILLVILIVINIILAG